MTEAEENLPFDGGLKHSLAVYGRRLGILAAVIATTSWLFGTVALFVVPRAQRAEALTVFGDGKLWEVLSLAPVAVAGVIFIVALLSRLVRVVVGEIAPSRLQGSEAAIGGWSFAGGERDRVDERVSFGNVEPAILSFLKWLDPLATVLTLALCMSVFGVSILQRAYGALAALAFILVSQIFARTHRDEDLASKSTSAVFSKILLEWAAVTFILLLLAFGLNVTAQFPREPILAWFVSNPLVLFGLYFVRVRVRWAISNSDLAPKYVIIGANNVGMELFRRLPKKGFMGFFDFRSFERLSATIDFTQFAGHCRELAEFTRRHGVTSIYIALPLANVPRVGEMVRELRDTTASIYFVPDIFAFDLIQGKLVDINGMPALSVCDTPFHGADAVLKRAFDLVFAGVALVIGAPLMLLIALGVKWSSPGPILFRQRRYGLHGEEINVYKFRTMTVCEDGPNVRRATRNDPRITPFGRFLRRTSLDDLPQLFNVMEGKMSLVGPRPHAVAHNEQYRKLISGYMIRHKVRPGITGLAQINGFGGETDTVEKMSDRVRYDLEYLRRWSPWLDVTIVLKAIWLALVRENAY